MSLEEDLDRLLNPVESGALASPERKQRQADWKPGFAWNGETGEVTTYPMPNENLPDWAHVLRIWGLDPDEFSVVEPVVFNVWGDTSGTLNRQWKGKVIKKVTTQQIDYNDLVAEIKKHKPRKLEKIVTGASLVVVVADWQTGKKDGDGLKGLVTRWMNAIDQVETRWKELKKIGRPLESITVLCVGDLVEGCDGFYDMQTFGVELDRRDQVKVARRLLRDALIRWSKFAPEIMVAAVGGNHGENRKGGKAFTSFNDNDDVALVESVAEIFAANPEAYGHIRFAIPKDRLTLTIEVCGKIIGITHGHLARFGGTVEQKLKSWLSGQSLGRQSIGECDILVTGHYHHFRSAPLGAIRWVMSPALDGGSEWWEQSTGQNDQAGVLTFVVSPKGMTDLEILC
jgi:predicted phosphodiesterase